MLRTAIALLLLQVGWCSAAEVGCGDNPADIVFVLDSSSSIWPPDYQTMLGFVNTFIDTFTIGPENVQIGAITFSDFVHKEFFLNDFKTKGPLKTRVKAITHKLGQTNTAHAIDFLNQKCFTAQRGMRDGLPHIGIVITDGESADKAATAQAAQSAKAAGITMYAIGVGKKVNSGELHAIASKPENVFKVDSFGALDEIKEILAIKVCVKACGEKQAGDVVFLVDSYKTGDKQTAQALTFMSNISSQMEIADDKIHVGLVHQCLIGGFQLNTYKTQGEITDVVEHVQVQDFADLIQHMKLRSFTVEEGARKGAKRIAVAIMDSVIPDENKAIAAADEAKADNIEMFVIGIGKGLSRRQLTLMASSPSDQHVFTVDTYDDLPDTADKIKINICKDL